MAKKIVKEEEIKVPSKKLVVKEEMVVSLDENKNIIKKPIQVIVEEKTIDEEVEQKIVSNLSKPEKTASIDFDIDNSINDSFMEIEAEEMKDDDDIFTEPVVKENKNIINEVIIDKPKVVEVIKPTEVEIKPTEVEIKPTEVEIKPIEVVNKIKEEVKVVNNENKNIKSEEKEKKVSSDTKIIKDTASEPLKKTEVFHYNAPDKVRLIQDKPSVPLQAEGLSGKKLYESYLDRKFVMIYNGELLYDSEKSSYLPIFHNNYFELYSIKYSYRGLRIKIKE
jgi:hypothetical protein